MIGDIPAGGPQTELAPVTVVPAVRETAPADIDPNVPNVARMYDYFLGGKDNFAADRLLADRVEKELPDVRNAIRANRNFLGRAVRTLAEDGIDQFIDLGSGLPTTENVHQIAQRINPGAHVVYVDFEPQVACHGRALLADNDNTVFVEKDVRELGGILALPEVTKAIDFARPVAVLMLAIVHFLADDDEVAALFGLLREALQPGSRLVLSHASPQGLPKKAIAAGTQLYNMSNAPMTVRDNDRIAALLPGWEWMEPGLVPVSDWHTSNIERTFDATRTKFVGGIAAISPAPELILNAPPAA